MRAQANGGGIPPRVLNTLSKMQKDLVNKPPTDVIFYQNEEGNAEDI
jgi:hypothetical protein